MTTINNPILRGFNPDPTILRVGDDYYIMTSSFEWWPGTPVYHSRDLVHWEMIGHALTNPAAVDLRGVIDSAGIWAPSLSFSDGLFHLIYTVVRTRVGDFKDVHNYLVTASDILGPWSEPIYLNSSGFDPSLFHDDDGRKWLVNMEWDFRKGQPRFGGIVLQEYDPTAKKTIGPITKILTKPCLIEGPNLYKRNGLYYLMLAEGGTGWNHGISMARSSSVDGPYELDPQHSVITSRDDESLPLQKAGHGELVETAAGEWILAHLASRPVGPDRRCMMGRETCLQRVEWTTDGWLRLVGGGPVTLLSPDSPTSLEPHPFPTVPTRDDFDEPGLGVQWSSLRVPFNDSWASLAERPGWLRLRGRESMISLFEQSLVAKRLEECRAVAETRLDYAPEHFTQMAGLICYYDTRTHYYLRVTHDAVVGRVLGVVLSDDGKYDDLLATNISIADWPAMYLRAAIDGVALQFSASPNGETWQPVGPVLDASKLSDDYGQGLHFTGAFVGLCAQDLRGTKLHADFDYFDINYHR
ncbi:MAG TPA: glycoside hydrolase family 43 protein [Capsulimonadaceae bacterium]|jgi:xylan 1,4-beta-xylosidase